jgi:hypothetical protein
MSPTPLIELQRRLTLVGAIRAGGEKQPKAPGRKLEAFRLTSANRNLIEQAALLYGGQVQPWEGPNGPEAQVYTESPELPILVMPGYSLRQSYELWEGTTKQTRRCDGLEEELSGGPCLCEAEGRDSCDIYTRLVVCLPELDTVLGWRLITRGANAAHEMPTMFALLERFGGSTFVPAKLRLDQRRGVKDGQVVRYVVPTIDLGVGYLALAAPASDGSRELVGAGFTPAPSREPTVEQALAVRPSTPAPSGGRRTAAFGPNIDPDARAEPAERSAFPEVTPPAPAGENPPVQPEEQTKAPTQAQLKKLNVLVGRLREAGQITTTNLWDAVAKMRGLGGEELVLFLDGYDEALQLHWSPLRDALTRVEATQLIDRLEGLEARTGAPSEPETPGEAPKEGGGDEPEDRPGPVPYNEFPPGY